MNTHHDSRQPRPDASNISGRCEHCSIVEDVREALWAAQVQLGDLALAVKNVETKVDRLGDLGQAA